MIEIMVDVRLGHGVGVGYYLVFMAIMPFSTIITFTASFTPITFTFSLSSTPSAPTPSPYPPTFP